MKKVFYAQDYITEIATTRAVARELFDKARDAKAQEISLKNIAIASRSFMHELLVLSSDQGIEIIDCNQNITRLIEVIKANKPVRQFEFRRAAPIKI